MSLPAASRPKALGLLAVLAAGCALCPPVFAAPSAPAPKASAAKPPAGKGPAAIAPLTAKDALAQLNPGDGSAIVAVVNGDVISVADVDARRRLFALSAGMPITSDVLQRLTSQVVKQLIDEKLRLQEMQKRKITVADKEIAGAIAGIEQQNHLPAGTLRGRLAAQGVPIGTLIDQVRVQLGWNRVLRQVIADQASISDADIKQQQDLLKAETGQPEFQISAIFIPISDPSQADSATHFADTVITQLRAGAPFSMVAAQFSQDPSALSGGDLGWVQSAQLDPTELQVLSQMPVGAVSNPITVPGGLSIVTLRAKREIGNDPATIVTMRQLFYPFSTPLDPNAPTDQQRQAVEQARKTAAGAKSCDAMSDIAKTLGAGHGNIDPGEVRTQTVAVPALRQLLETQPLNTPSQPLVATDGVAVIMVCTRETKNMGVPDSKELADRIINTRVDLASRQLIRELQRRAIIDQRV